MTGRPYAPISDWMDSDCPFTAFLQSAWIYSEWSEKNQQIEQESSQLQIDVQTVSGVQRMGTSDFLIGAIAGQIPAEFEVETLKAQAVMARSCLYKQAGDRYYISALDTGMTWCSETERKKIVGNFRTKRIMTESVRRSGKRTGRFCILKAGR